MFLNLEYSTNHEVRFDKYGITPGPSGSLNYFDLEDDPSFVLFCTIVSGKITKEMDKACAEAALESEEALAYWISANCLGLDDAEGIENEPLERIRG